MPPYRRVAIVLLWKYCHSHSFSRVNFQACALILPLCQQNVESAEQIFKRMRIWIAPAPPSVPHPYQQSRNIFGGDAIRDEHSNGRKFISSFAYVSFEFTWYLFHQMSAV